MSQDSAQLQITETHNNRISKQDWSVFVKIMCGAGPQVGSLWQGWYGSPNLHSQQKPRLLACLLLHHHSQCHFRAPNQRFIHADFKFKKFYIYFVFDFWERVREGEREGKKNIDWLLSICTSGDQTWLGMCPDQESNWRPFSSWDDVQLTEPHQPGLKLKA